ncbi:rod shape-determining protein MreD [Chloroflexi bacterium TSY]|nr:rod shape-determining protein MreD [Chloroflexi bacterium TSY]
MKLGVQSYIMVPLLGIASIIQATITNRFAFGGTKPDIVLFIILVWTLIFGPRSGVVWAFIGGLWLDIFSGGPTGGSSLALMAASLVAGYGYGIFSRYNLLVPFLTGIVGAVTFSLTYLVILDTVALFDPNRRGYPWGLTIENIVIPSVLYNATLMLVAIPFLNWIPENRSL